MPYKFFISLIVIIFTIIPAFAKNEITFIYLNGSNTNTQNSKEDFIKGVNKLHNQIIQNFECDAFIYGFLLEGGKYKINKTPNPFYWGDLSKVEIELIKNDFDFLKQISPKPANHVREFIALCLHDAIWVSKQENMMPILENLHKIIVDEYNKGNKTALLGYSAGTFIVHQYMFLKVPVINLKEAILRSNIEKKYKDYVADINMENTCTDALFKNSLVRYDIDNRFIFEENFNDYKTKISKLNDDTKKYCAPKDALVGGINFASPFALFYSDLFDKDYKMSEEMALAYKFIIENKLFWLTVNYSDDPLGFPLTRNVTYNDIKNLTNLEIKDGGGFIYDKSDKPSRRTFLMAHLSYFNTSKRYAKILTDAFIEGFEHFYMTKED